ncbi:MAG: GAF domain-containing protein [Anaerolineales bacterium]|nr:GAF domain-containing protein [Anaerolineales bacterium]
MNDQSKSRDQLVTELQQLRGQIEALKASEALFRQAVLSISDHIYISEVVANGAYINRYISPHAEQLTGYPLEKFTGDWSFWPTQVIHPEDQTRAATQAQRLAQGKNSEAEYRLIRADGQIIWVRDSGKVHDDHQTQTRTIYGVVSDITQRKQLEEQLAAIYQLGQELNLLRHEPEIFQRVLDTAARLLQVKTISYELVAPDDDQANFDQHGIDKTTTLTPPLWPAQPEPMTLRATNGTPAAYLAVTDNGTITVVVDKIEQTELIIPLRVGTRELGLLKLKRDTPGAFSIAEQQLLQTLADQAAVAVENARLYREIGQRVEELVSMSMISQAITSTLNLPETLTIITDHAVRLFNAMSASVALLDKSSGCLHFAASSGVKSDFVLGKQLAPGQGVAGWVVQYGEPALVPDTSQDPRFFSEMDKQSNFTTASILCYPLQNKSGTIGAIEVINKKGGTFTQTDLRLLSWLSMPAVNAIENARLFEAQHIARRQAEMLREATSTLTSVLDLDQVLERILVHLERVIPYDSACIFLRDDQQLRIVAGRGRQVEQKQVVGRVQHSADNVLYRRIETFGRPVILPDARIDPDFSTWENGLTYIRGWMGVPLVAKNEVIGYVTLDSHRVNAYGPTDAELAQAFANQAAVAIENARLFEQVSIGRKRLQSLSHRLVEVQEKERRYVARELHDEAGQALALLKLELRLLEQDLDKPEAIREHLTALNRTTSYVSENLHRLAKDLHPATLEHLGLVPALRQFVESFGKQHHLILHFETIGLENQRLPQTIEINLYRIVQEALANSVRHARATHASVLIERREASIVTIAEDNGRGFDPDDTARTSGRLGLLSMRERADMMGGVFEIESSPGTGTTVYVEIPYANQHSDR